MEFGFNVFKGFQLIVLSLGLGAVDRFEREIAPALVVTRAWLKEGHRKVSGLV